MPDHLDVLAVIGFFVSTVSATAVALDKIEQGFGCAGLPLMLLAWFSFFRILHRADRRG